MPIDSPFDSLSGIRSPFGRGRGKPAIITATTAPSLGPLTDGDTLSDAVTWGTYSSTAGTIVTPTTKEMSVNSGAFISYNGATVVAFNDTYTPRETVADSAGNTQTFGAGTQTVEQATAAIATAPVISGTPLRIATIDIQLGTYSGGDYAATGTLRRNGMPVLIPSFTESDTSFQYQIPFEAEVGSIIRWDEESFSGLTQSVEVTVLAADPDNVPEFSVFWNGSQVIASSAELVVELQ